MANLSRKHQKIVKIKDYGRGEGIIFTLPQMGAGESISTSLIGRTVGNPALPSLNG
jgi:hypothetical protein